MIANPPLLLSFQLILGSLLVVLGLREYPPTELLREEVSIGRCKSADVVCEDCNGETCYPDWLIVSLPIETEGLNVTLSCHKGKKVKVTSNDAETTGNRNTFRNVSGGKLKITHETIDQSESYTMMSPVAMACVSLVLASGVCSYLAHISI